MNELVQYEAPTSIVETNARRRWVELMKPAADLAKAVAGTDFVKGSIRHNPGAIAACVLYGDEVGLGPMQALAQISVIDGRPALSAEAMRALILAAGHELWIEESTVSKATIAGRRRDSEQTSRVTWTMDDARRAHLHGKQNWRSYPRQMLAARATAELARMIFADAIGGLAILEELDESEPTTGGARRKASEGQTRKREDATLSRSSRPRAPDVGSDEGPPLPGERGYGEEVEASEKSRRKMHASFRELGISDRAARLEIASGILGREVTTTKDLSADDVSAVIDALAKRIEAEAEGAESDSGGDEPAATDESSSEPEAGDEPGEQAPTSISLSVVRARLAAEGIEPSLIQEVGRELYPGRNFSDLAPDELELLVQAIRDFHNERKKGEEPGEWT